ncbi:MAG: hypothetical protein LBB22_01205 [Treponema sp.]|jgi:hypothetical protein|nr:hypothetical protein [Treponema sp.]
MTAAILRKELHMYIDSLSDQSLPALKPLLMFLSDDYWKPVIESASPEETAMIEERSKDYEKDPSSWVSLADIK